MVRTTAELTAGLATLDYPDRCDRCGALVTSEAVEPASLDRVRTWHTCLCGNRWASFWLAVKGSGSACERLRNALEEMRVVFEGQQRLTELRTDTEKTDDVRFRDALARARAALGEWV